MEDSILVASEEATYHTRRTRYKNINKNFISFSINGFQKNNYNYKTNCKVKTNQWAVFESRVHPNTNQPELMNYQSVVLAFDTVSYRANDTDPSYCFIKYSRPICMDVYNGSPIGSPL